MFLAGVTLLIGVQNAFNFFFTGSRLPGSVSSHSLPVVRSNNVLTPDILVPDLLLPWDRSRRLRLDNNRLYPRRIRLHQPLRVVFRCSLLLLEPHLIHAGVFGRNFFPTALVFAKKLPIVGGAFEALAGILPACYGGQSSDDDDGMRFPV